MRTGALAVAALVLVALLAVWAAEPGWFRLSTSLERSPPLSLTSFEFDNFTARLGATFVNGAPQAFGYNGSAALVTGVVGVPTATSVPFGLLGSIGGLPADPVAQNLSAEIAALFHGGDTLGIGWNGSSWLITGEAAWGTVTGGAAAALSNGQWTNLTPVLGPYFSGQGGIWFDAWNGSAWMLGGASDNGTSLVALQGSTVRDLTPLIPHHGRNTWIQSIGWNGTAWLVGGHGIFGTLTGNHYLDLFPGSTFSHGGMYAADWNGSSWLVGGGSPGTIEFLRGGHLAPGPALASNFNWWVDTVVWDGHGWMIGGKGSSPHHPYDAMLEYLDGASGSLVDLSAGLPGSFSGGQVQFGALAPFAGPGSVLLVGQGGLPTQRITPGTSEGAAVVVTRA